MPTPANDPQYVLTWRTTGNTTLFGIHDRKSGMPKVQPTLTKSEALDELFRLNLLTEETQHMKSRRDLEDVPLGQLRQVTVVFQTGDFGMRTRCIDAQLDDLVKLIKMLDEISVS